MTRRSLSILMFVALAALVGYVIWGGDGDAPEGRPNVLIISLDTFRADHAGFLGARLDDGSSPTPALDRLAADCVASQEAMTPSPLTLPAHVTLLSGLYPDRHGVRENDSFRVPAERPWSLLAEDLRQDYATGAVVSGQPLESRYGLDAGFATYLDTDRTDNPTDRLRFRERDASETTDLALKWLSSVQGRPWFLLVHYFDAHDPYVWHGPRPGLAMEGSPEERRRRAYRSETMHVDEHVGRLLAGLPGGGEDTLIIVVGDHGEGLGEHGEETHGFTVRQSTMRVPFLLKPPGGEKGRAPAPAAAPARLVDVYATVLRCCGVEDPDGRDGRDLLSEPEGEWLAFGETLYPYYQFQYAHERYVMDGDRKLITGGSLGDRLYAWREDPGEKIDLAEREPQRVRDLTERLNAHLARPGFAAAEDVAVEPNAAFPYMGGRPLALPVEPGFESNRTLPSAEARWDVIGALDEARRRMRPPRRQPHLASAALAPFAEELSTNPSLLWWTARAYQLQARAKSLDVDTRVGYLDRAMELYARHHQQFRDGRAFDARLRALLTKHELLRDGPALLQALVREASGAIQASGRPLTYALRGKAYFELGQ